MSTVRRHRFAVGLATVVLAMAVPDALLVATQIPATDVPLFVSAGWFRMAADKFYVPIALAVPGSAVPSSTDKVTLDVAGFIRDERGFPVGRIRDTLTVPPAGANALAARQVLYQTGVTLPPGRFSVKVVVRENTSGRMGTFETPIVVPELKNAPVKVSSLVVGTQLQNVGARKTNSPLVRDGVELVPSLTHIVSRDQKLYFYYEVYDPAAENGTPHIRTNLSFYRGKVKVLDTPIVERTRLDAADRRAAVFQFELSGPEPEAGAVHVSDQHHRSGCGPVRLSPARAVRALIRAPALG